MDREVNIDSIRALEEQVREHERAVIRLRRTRNSLLNVSQLPPELLGKIFHCNITPKGDFDGLDDGSHNFLLVCHHWFEVASRTPDLWSFWGNTPKDWARWCHRSGTAPLDLAYLGERDYDEKCFTTPLRKVLQNHATRDAIRSLHLSSNNPRLLHSIIASLISNRDQELRSTRIESLILRNRNEEPVDISNFFAHYRFPKLRRLGLTNCTVSSWDHLTSKTSALSTLVLDFNHCSSTPTTSQLLSMLAFNPTLRKVGLFLCPTPDGGEEFPFRVQLHRLKELRLEGDLRHTIGLLHQLDHPRNMDNLSLNLHNSDVTDISHIVGPYLRDHLERRDAPQDGLKVYVSMDPSGHYCGYHVRFRAGDAGGIDFSTPESAWRDTFVEINALLNTPLVGAPRTNVLKRAALDLVTYTPLEEVVYFQAHNTPAVVEDIRTQFPRLKTLSFDAMCLSTAFPNPNPIADQKMFPSLERVILHRVVTGDSGWSPLVTFLTRRVSSGNRLDALEIIGPCYMCQEEEEEDIRGMVRELTSRAD